MKILFLFPYPLKESPSQRFRFEQYDNFLRENGFQIAFQSFWNIKTWKILFVHGHLLQKIVGLIKGLTKRFLMLFQLSEINYIFIHRECLPIGPPIIEWVIVKILKKKLIYDFDDAIWLPNTSKENKLASFLKWNHNCKRICKWSYKVSCGNNFLAEFARRFSHSVVVNPTTIDTINLHNPNLYLRKKEKPVTIGWTGTHSTLPYLELLVPTIRQVETQHAIRFVVIANKKPDFITDTIEFKHWNQETEIEDLMEFDIGIMPLPDDIWARGKCGFKILQYMALEIPAVASPVGVNTTIISNGVDGFLCKSNDAWLETLTQLIHNKELRREIGRKARQKVIQSYSVESNSRSFLNLFS